ncbi:MAG TPA: hypothetical protein VM121_01020 [Acidimicrobiales bacterium]|nr:hypothetical protein [Acidimicrobiales bacterium]
MATSPSDAEVAAIVMALEVLRQQAIEVAPAPTVPAWRWGDRRAW